MFNRVVHCCGCQHTTGVHHNADPTLLFINTRLVMEKSRPTSDQCTTLEPRLLWRTQRRVRLSKYALVFPIRDKILKPGFRVAEKFTQENPSFFGYRNRWFCAAKTQYHFEIATVVQYVVFSNYFSWEQFFYWFLQYWRMEVKAYCLHSVCFSVLWQIISLLKNLSGSTDVVWL